MVLHQAPQVQAGSGGLSFFLHVASRKVRPKTTMKHMIGMQAMANDVCRLHCPQDCLHVAAAIIFTALGSVEFMQSQRLLRACAWHSEIL